VLSLMGVTAGACSPRSPAAEPDPATSVVLRGVVTYRARLALPPGTRITVRLADVSRADGPASVVARDRLDPGRRYTVQARVEQAGALWFLTTATYPVDPTRWPESMDVVVEPSR
jgi:putative lipoprotein